jgi:pimeloyl-ACP methyl ester carboxylesterase
MTSGRQRTMKDLVVILPGITGSVLSIDNTSVFEATNRLLVSTWYHRGRNLDVLKMPVPDPQTYVLPDRVEATSLFNGPHWLLGMGWVDGYSQLSQRIIDEFATSHHAEDGNFYHFPYDWRRDNRVAAQQLKDFLDEKLAWWHDNTENDDARVILLTHSMGGLVARHYLEVLGGWKYCRALVTFGTPFRGSVEALKLLVDGAAKGGVDLSDVVRSFASVYQLLPIYPVIKHNGKEYRIAELSDLPYVDQDRARDAQSFHKEIRKKVEENRKLADWKEKGYQTIPVVGVRQRTMQSAVLTGSGFEFSHEELPSMVNPLKWDGDGTVPRVSAVPVDLDDALWLPMIADRHGSLQANDTVLDLVFNWIYQMQGQDKRPVLGGEAALAAGRARLGLGLDDAYPAGAPVTLKYRMTDAKPRLSGALMVEITALEETPAAPGQSEPVVLLRAAAPDDQWHEISTELAPGAYRLTLRNIETKWPAACPVHDVFEVVAG